jgi:predicted RNase H-like HicB family nuclease
MQLSAVFMQVPEGYIGVVEEIPVTNTQGETLEQTRENLREAVDQILEANRKLAKELLIGQTVIRVPLTLPKS